MTVNRISLYTLYTQDAQNHYSSNGVGRYDAASGSEFELGVSRKGDKHRYSMSVKFFFLYARCKKS